MRWGGWGFGFRGIVAIVEVLVDGIADGLAPGVRAEGGAEIAGGEVFAGKEIGQIVGEFIGGAGLGFLAGVIRAEMGMVTGAGSAALAAIGKGETTQGLAVL